MGLTKPEFQLAKVVDPTDPVAAPLIQSKAGNLDLLSSSLPWISVILCILSLISTFILLMICFCVDRAKKHQQQQAKQPRVKQLSIHDASTNERQCLDKSIESIGSPSDLGQTPVAGRNNARSALYVQAPGSPESTPSMPMTQLSCDSGVATFTRSCSLTTGNRSHRLPASWFPWLVDKIRPSNSGDSEGGGSNTGKLSRKGKQQLKQRLSRSAADTLVAAAVEDYQFASIKRLTSQEKSSNSSSTSQSRSQTTIYSKPGYDSQMSRNSQYNRELPPVPSHEESPTHSVDHFPSAMTTSISNQRSTTPPQQPQLAALADVESLATCDSQYDLLLATETALLMENAQFRSNTLDYCDCGEEGCRLSQEAAANDGAANDEDDDDVSSCDDVDPFYSTIRRKQAGCLECGVASLYTAGGSSRHSVVSTEGGVAMDMGAGEMTLRHQHHAHHQGAGEHKSGTSTPNSHLYSKICKQQPAQSRPSQRPLRSSRTGSSPRVGVRPASSGPSLMREGLEALNRACIAPVAGGEEAGGTSCSGSLWSVAMSNTTGGHPRPGLPSRGYGESELDILRLLRGSDDNTEPACCPHHHQHHSSTAAPACCHGNQCTSGQRRPSLHQLLLLKGYQTSQPALGSCSNLPILQPLNPSTVAHFRQNSYSDHQLAPISSPTADDEDSSSGHIDFAQCHDDATILRSGRKKSPAPANHQQGDRDSSIADSDIPFSESLCQAEEEYADIYEALDNLDVTNDNCDAYTRQNRFQHQWQFESDGINNNNTDDGFDYSVMNSATTARASTVTAPSTLAFVPRSRLPNCRPPNFNGATGKTVFSLLTYRAKLYSSQDGGGQQPPDENDNPFPVRMRPNTNYPSDEAPLSPSILVEMKTFRHMDSDLDLSNSIAALNNLTTTAGTTGQHTRPMLMMMTPLMERSMESAILPDDASISPITTPPPVPPMLQSFISCGSGGIGTPGASSGSTSNFRHSTASSDMVMCDDSSPSPSSLSCTSSSPHQHLEGGASLSAGVSSSPVKIFALSTRSPQVPVTAGRSPQR